MKTLKTITVLFVLLAVGCGSRSVGHNNNVNDSNSNENTNVNTNQNNNNEVQPDLLTYRIFTNEFVEDVLEYEQDPTRPCTRDFPDMEDNEEDDRLCRNMMTLDDLHADQAGYPDGTLRPDYADPQAVYWLTTLRSFGFFLYAEGILAQDVGIYDWFGGANGSLTHKGLLTVDENALAYPSYSMTLEEWDEWKTRIQDWLNENVQRIEFTEVMLAKFYGGPTITPSECMSGFSDIDNGSFECMVTHTGLDYGIIEADVSGNFRPYAGIIWPEIIKFSLTARNIPETTEECWAPCNGQNLWYCPWVNAACLAGILPSHLTTLEDMQRSAKRLPTFKWLYKILMLDI